MSRKSKQHDKQFKLDALKYVTEHPNLTQEECCKNLGISLSTLSRWKSQYLDNNGDIPTGRWTKYHALHELAGFRTDYEIARDKAMRGIIRKSKQRKYPQKEKNTV